MSTRRPIYVETPAFSEAEIRGPLTQIIEQLDAYLDTYTARGYTRHAIMGPIPGILDALRSGETHAPSLLGAALRQHEMASLGGYVAPAGQAALESATVQLIQLLAGVPITYRHRLLDKVDLGVYYERRKKASQRMEERRLRFVEFMRERYVGRETALQADWRVATADALPYPARRRLTEGNQAQRDDVQAFFVREDGSGDQPVEDEEEERP